MITGIIPLEEIPNKMSAERSKDPSVLIRTNEARAVIKNPSDKMNLLRFGVAICGIVTAPTAPIATGIAASRPALEGDIPLSERISGIQLLVP